VKGFSCTEEIQLGRHLINPVEALSSLGKKGDFYYFQTSGVLKTNKLYVVGLIDQRSVFSQRKKAASLMLRKHMINLAEVVIEIGSLRICRRPKEHREVSLVISWLGMGVARVLRVNSFEPMVGWKGKHPQSVGWLQLVIDKYFIFLVLTIENVNVFSPTKCC
jgi:hypothetical protein